MTPRTGFPELMYGFFSEWLSRQRDLSPHTIRSYRDSWRLFLRFLEERRHKKVQSITLTDLTRSEILAFLDYSEHDRHVCIGTRNCRLAAICTFFDYAAQRDPAAIAQSTEVRGIPRKRAIQRAMCYLELEELEAILDQPNRSTLEGQRDYALLVFLYNTGARIQEALDLRPRDIRFESASSVKLLGKGRKERICPLWPETAQLLKALLKRQPRSADQVLFVNRYGYPLGASGARYKLTQYVTAATRVAPSLAKKDISPHSFRHSAAVQLIASGVDTPVIRAWFGHASLDTTSHYAQANLQTKRAALERVTPPRGARRQPRWKHDADLLAWLDSL
jgi:integrase/recombinase XerC